MAKDFRLAVEAAHSVSARLILGEAGLDTYTRAAQDPRCRDLDSRVVYRWLGGIEPEQDTLVGGEAGDSLALTEDRGETNH